MPDSEGALGCGGYDVDILVKYNKVVHYRGKSTKFHILRQI